MKRKRAKPADMRVDVTFRRGDGHVDRGQCVFEDISLPLFYLSDKRSKNGKKKEDTYLLFCQWLLLGGLTKSYWSA